MKVTTFFTRGKVGLRVEVETDSDRTLLTVFAQQCADNGERVDLLLNSDSRGISGVDFAADVDSLATGKKGGR